MVATIKGLASSPLPVRFVLQTGDAYALPSPAYPHGLASHVASSEAYPPFSAYFDAPPILTDAFGDDVLTQKVSEYFADGAPQTSGARVDAIAFNADEQGNAIGFRLRFTADGSSSVAWNEDAGYSVFGARLQITTLTGKFAGLGP